jgi:hypothetical protein
VGNSEAYQILHSLTSGEELHIKDRRGTEIGAGARHIDRKGAGNDRKIEKEQNAAEQGINREAQGPNRVI